MKARHRYLGKQALEELDQELARNMKSVQDHLNAGFDATGNRVLVRGVRPVIYCDYIEPSAESNPLINALAFYESGRYFLGLTTPLVIRLSECAGYLAHSPHVRDLFGIPFGDNIEKDRQRGAIIYSPFFGHQLNFVFGHELGHHFFGHTTDEETCFWEEYSLDLSHRHATIPLTSHANEIQADAYAAEYLLTALFQSGVGGNSLRLLGRLTSDSEARQLLIGVYVASVCGVLFALPNPSFNEQRLAHDHPLKAARLSNMISRVRLYLDRVAPDLVEWLSVEKVNHFAEKVRSSIPPTPASWNDETAYLISESGAKYYKDLMEEVDRLNRVPNPYRWVFV